MKIIRIVIAAPFILIGAAFYWIGELISGQIYARHEGVVRRNVIFQHGLVQANHVAKHGPNGFRRFSTKRKKK